ncbi:MAG: hypothetical protein IJA52_00920 [Clostridia bacterium]|nr:hypothetical protein [Clostridia bacterium]
MGYIIAAGILLFIILLVLITSLICFFRVFYSPERKILGDDEYDIPEGEIYEVYRDKMVRWIKEVRAMPHEDVSITSFDGLTLRGKYYECKKGAPVEIMFHGYQGNSERDMGGGVFRSFALEHNVLVVDHRASGRSDGHVISFGINEKRDCLLWVDFAVSRFGRDVQIILTGISMGAATVVMAAGDKNLRNVIYVLADCPYSSARRIIKKVVKEMGLPPKLIYPFIRLGAWLFGHFRLEEDSPIEAVKRARVPIIFFHGENDDFVPCEMSRELYDACPTKKMLVTVPEAGHGLCVLIDRDGYVSALRRFEETILQ